MRLRIEQMANAASVNVHVLESLDYDDRVAARMKDGIAGEKHDPSDHRTGQPE